MGENDFYDSGDNMDTNLLKKNLLQVFQYLQSYYSLKNPVKKQISEHPWHLWLDAIPQHEAVTWGAAGVQPEENDALAEDFIVKIRRPGALECPEPPAKVDEWLEAGWTAPDNPAKLQKEKEKVVIHPFSRVEETVMEKFEDVSSRVELYEEWSSKREEWRQKELNNRKVMEIYDRCYSLYAQIKREAEQVELVLADGILKAGLNRSEATCYPLLSQRVEIRFDSDIPEFTIVLSDKKPEFYSDLLRQLPQVNPAVIGECRSKFDAQIAALYDNDAEVNSFLHSISAKLEAKGRFTSDPAEFNQVCDRLLILKRPVLVLRGRIVGFAAFMEKIIDDIGKVTELPASLVNILGFETKHATGDGSPENAAYLTANGESEVVLFSKEANPEQLQIAQKLERSGAVLVQGPPGTGKTHTIANLIGHFLAQGKTVLVTSHTSKALRVLKEKIVPSLQPLCVTVFNEEKDQLERCVEAITEFISSNDRLTIEREAEQLSAARNEILARLWNYKQRLLELRKGEHHPLILGERVYRVKEAAVLVATEKTGNDWIPSPVTSGSALPLTKNELIRLYQTNLTLSEIDEDDLRMELPDPAILFSPDEFEQSMKEIDTLTQAEAASGLEYWSGETNPDFETLQQLTTKFRRAGELLKSASLWEQNVLSAGLLKGHFVKPWQTLIANIQATFEKYAAFQSVALDFEPFIPEPMVSTKTIATLAEIVNHLHSGKKLQFSVFMFHKEWKELLAQVKVKQVPPVTAEDFEHLLYQAELEMERHTLRNRWQKLIAQSGGPGVEEFGSSPECGMRNFTERIVTLLNWHAEQWIPLEQSLAGLGFRWREFWSGQPIFAGDDSGLKRLVSGCAELEKVVLAKLQLLRADRLKQCLEQKTGELEDYLDSPGAAAVIRSLQQGLARRDTAIYRQSYERIVELTGKAAEWAGRIANLARLAEAAPVWAEAIRNREGIHGGGELPGDPEKAWEWRQLNDDLDTRGNENLEFYQREIAELSFRLRQVTVELIEKRTWAKICLTSIAERQALVGWKELMKRIGKGKGKRVQIHTEAARQLMPKCQAAVPVWIMPLIRVAESFDPSENQFDVVVIDEASQSDPLALSALYLGKQVIVVGDDQQVSPDAVGQNQDDIQRLINEFLEEIPNRQLFDGQSSVYDLAKCSFDPVCLREHFRCVEPIIEFSNRLSYDGRIKPLRDDSEVLLKPATVAYQVKQARAVNKVNPIEAETLASLLVAAIEQPEYGNASFGVISLLGTEQALLIDDILRKRLPEKEYTGRQILCGNPAQFQGDERDVIFISVVDTGKEEGQLAVKSSGARDMFRKRYNVAASRARDQMWVVHSLDARDLKAGDLRLRLILHASNPCVASEGAHTATTKGESEFERLVMEYLSDHGYRVYPQWKVGTYRIDLVAVFQNKKIAIECDGEKFQTDQSLAEDMTRQAILERLGWRFIRIRGSRFFRDPQNTMTEVLRQLHSFGIYPESVAPLSAPESSDLVMRVIRRAEQIRLEWHDRDVRS
jgi:very-short-patch-repair endonuclease